MEKQIENILSQVAEIVRQDREQRAEKEKSGKCFNLFDALGLKKSEKVHSAFIAELLNPNGQHGFGDTFLRAFIKSIGCLNDWGFNTSYAKIETEYYIGQINKTYTQGGIVDILIQSQDKAIIIENKIYAPDQKKQLIRYKHFAEKTYKSEANYRLIYLTLDGCDASYDSTRDQLKVDNDYYTIGYSSEILEWLKVCESESSQNIMIGSAITQYIKTIKDLINQDMLPENSDRIVEIMSHPENVEAVLTIQNHINEWEYKVVEKYLIPQLQKWADDNNLRFNEWGFLEEQNGFGFYFYRKEWIRSAIWIYTENQKKWKDFYIDISSYDGKKLFPKRPLLDKKIFKEDPNNDSQLGWEHLDKYCCWDIPNIFNGNIAKHIIEKVKGVLDKIDQMDIEML